MVASKAPHFPIIDIHLHAARKDEKVNTCSLMKINSNNFRKVFT